MISPVIKILHDLIEGYFAYTKFFSIYIFLDVVDSLDINGYCCGVNEIVVKDKFDLNCLSLDKNNKIRTKY